MQPRLRLLQLQGDETKYILPDDDVLVVVEVTKWLRGTFGAMLSAVVARHSWNIGIRDESKSGHFNWRNDPRFFGSTIGCRTQFQ
jgi:hypothetical protein